MLLKKRIIPNPITVLLQSKVLCYSISSVKPAFLLRALTHDRTGLLMEGKPNPGRAPRTRSFFIFQCPCLAPRASFVVMPSALPDFSFFKADHRQLLLEAFSDTPTLGVSDVPIHSLCHISYNPSGYHSLQTL